MSIITTFKYISMSIPITKKGSRNQHSPQNKKRTSQNFIAISSDELQDKNEQLQIREQDLQCQLVISSVNQKERARKSQQLQESIAIIRKQIQQQQQERLKIEQQLAIKIQKRKEKTKKEQQLKKEFGPYDFLPIATLSYLKEQLANFGKYCLFEQVEEKQKGQQKTRQSLRKSLTRGMLISLEEIKFKIPESQRTELQRKILSPQADALKYCYKLASQLQSYFYNKICKKDANNGVSKYKQQINIILRQYRDKNNIDLRRNIINEKVTFKQLSTATDQSLRCQKTKQQEMERLRQFVRQSYISPLEYDKVEPEQKPQQPQIGSNNNIVSANTLENIKEPMDVQPKQTVQQKNMREKKEMIKDIREKYRRCQQSFTKHSRKISKMQEILKETHQNDPYFLELCKNIQIQI